MNRNIFWLGAAVLVLAGIVAYVVIRPDPPCVGADCSPPTPTATSTAAPGLVTISMASSITKREWLEAAIKTFNEASKSDRSLQVNGKPIKVEQLLEKDPVTPGTSRPYRSPTQVQDTAHGKIQPTVLFPADEAWISWLNKEWAATHSGQPITSEKPQSVARTPIIIAMQQSRAMALDCWPAAGPGCTWERLRALAADPAGWGALGHPDWGKLKFGYAYVGESDVGTQTAVLVCMSGLKKTEGLTVDDIAATNGCGQAMASVDKSKVRTGPSSPWLLEGLLTGPGYLDAVTTYEKEVIAFNRTNAQKLREPLVAAYPRDGTVVAGHPFAILDRAPWVTPEHVEAARVLQRFLLSPDQQKALASTGMRPADPATPLGAPFVVANGANPATDIVSVNVPDTLVLDRIQEVWREVKQHAVVTIAFDKSGSMAGEKINAAGKGAIAFVGKMYAQDWLRWLPFDGQVYAKAQGPKAEFGETLISEIQATPAGGGTALYDAIGQAYEEMEAKRKDELRRTGYNARYGIVVLSDGADTASVKHTMALLEALLKPSEIDPSGISIHTIGIGADADMGVLCKIAGMAHGKCWDATKTTEAVEAIFVVTVLYI